MSFGSVHVRFGKDVELHAVSVRKGADILSASRLLLAKLVARKGEDAETPRVQGLVEFHELLVVARGQTSFGGSVHDQAHAAGILGQLDRLSKEQVSAEFKEGRDGSERRW